MCFVISNSWCVSSSVVTGRSGGDGGGRRIADSEPQRYLFVYRWRFTPLFADLVINYNLPYKLAILTCRCNITCRLAWIRKWVYLTPWNIPDALSQSLSLSQIPKVHPCIYSWLKRTTVWIRCSCPSNNNLSQQQQSVPLLLGLLWCTQAKRP